MAWQAELDILLRVLINDTETPQSFSNSRLEQVIVVAGRLVVQELDFSIAYSMDVVNISITPDPTDTVGSTRNDSFINLVCAKAACIVDRGSALKAASQAIRVKDGASEVDLRDTFKAKLALLNKGWCAVYEDMKDEYIVSQTGVVVGAAILSPFRAYADAYGQLWSNPRSGNNYYP